MPSLQFIYNNPNGPQTVRLFKKITTLGSENTNDICISSQGLDDNHAYIVFDGKHYTISGVSKKNVIQINGKREKNYKLTHKDVITIGDVNLTFDLFDEMNSGAGESAQAEIAGYRKLHEFTERLLSQYRIEELLNSLIDLVIDASQADSGFLILKREDKGFEFTVARNLKKETIANAISYVSDTIIAKVVESRKSVIVSDAMNDDSFNKSVSVMNLKLSSVMCVPLIARGNFLGILYLGNNSVINLFTPEKLQLLEVFAGQASLLIQNALMVNELQLDRKELREKIDQIRFGSMIGSSEAMRDVFIKISKIAGVDVPVLIQGDTGTGKELVAREIHEKSPRKDGPFVAINCGAIPGELLESELFGHKRGAFTGAVSSRMGKFKAADGGTLFLDEVGDMPMELQVKILRALEEHRVVPVGETSSIEVDIRIVAATNQPLEQAIADGRFREDLYYRLNVIGLQLPPLRERGDDVLLIAKYFLNRYSEEYSRKIKGFSQRAVEALKTYAWPGNVRELENRIKKAVILLESNMVEPEDLEIEAAAQGGILQPLAVAREDFQKEYIRKALKVNNGNRTKTAQMLDVDPRTIFRYLEKMNEV